MTRSGDELAANANQSCWKVRIRDNMLVKIFEKGILVEKQVNDFRKFQLLIRDGDVISPKLGPQFTEIEDEVFLGPGAIITNDRYQGCEHFRECTRGPHIHASAVIGGDTTTLPGISIGSRSLVDVGNLVTDDVPPETMVPGNPEVVRKSIYDVKCANGITDSPYPR